MPNLTLELKLRCICKAPQISTVKGLTLVTDPCPSCLQANYEKGYEKGEKANLNALRLGNTQLRRQLFQQRIKEKTLISQIEQIEEENRELKESIIEVTIQVVRAKKKQTILKATLTKLKKKRRKRMGTHLV